MKTQTMTLAEAVRRGRCDRCNRRIRDDKNANTVMRAGYLAGFICSTCQTDEDRAEAVINGATIDYSTLTTNAFGQVFVSAKGVDQ